MTKHDPELIAARRVPIEGLVFLPITVHDVDPDDFPETDPKWAAGPTREEILKLKEKP